MDLKSIFAKSFGTDKPKTQDEKLTSISEQSPEETSLVTFVRGKLDERRSLSQRVTLEGTWLTNAAYLLGYSGLFYDTRANSFRSISGASLSRNRLQENIILPEVMTRASRLMQFAPRYDTQPKSNDTEDKEAARLGLEVLNDVFTRQQFRTKQLDLTMGYQASGHCYLKVCWDPSLGEPILGETGEVEGFEGDIRYDVVTAFEVYPDPLARSFHEITDLIHVKVRKLDYFLNQYPERGHLVQAEEAWLQSIQYENRLNTMNQRSSGLSNTMMQNSAVEISYYEKRSKKHPNGRLVTVSNGVLLADKELPIGEIPFAMYCDMRVTGRYYPEPIISQMRSPQDQYNMTINRRARWTQMLLAGKYVAPRGANLMTESPNDQSGEIIYYDPTPGSQPPTALRIPEIPSYAYTETDQLKKGVREFVGLSDISRGELPSASIPAQGMQILVEADQTRIGLITEQNEEAHAQVGNLTLKYVEKYWTNERLIGVSGTGGEYMVKSFRGDMLNGNTKVRVVRGSTLPGSKVLRRQELQNLYAMGLLGTPGDPKVMSALLDKMEYGDLPKVWKSDSLNANQLKEYIDLIQNQVMPPLDLRDDSVFIAKEMNDLRKEDKFKRYSPISQQLFTEFMNFHVEAVMIKSGLKDAPSDDPAGAAGVQEQELGDTQADASQLPPELNEMTDPTLGEDPLAMGQ